MQRGHAKLKRQAKQSPVGAQASKHRWRVIGLPEGSVCIDQRLESVQSRFVDRLWRLE